MNDNEVSRIVQSYKGMSHFADVEKMTAEALVELKALQERDGLSNTQLLELNDRTMRALLYRGAKTMTPKEKNTLKRVFLRLADIFSDK
ncbi:MAG: hypothetical protein KUF77_18630 [Candidatus Thiodiazotropha sp. (ex Lucina aurantia)]|nr:hypothetical protein [Candidatus Thiodiazotropha sp. (ex Lucina pensylvanica)]MBT3025241.1 hypothetical protein [Candidatus Thiodiazotropha taylori]MBV2098384.1 hypothetical protein [Candidatus Thiodiazotropha sp. (ex Codakia orbicularis)]MBV2105050.1 hypothetical protein [Candidatus Thiodiazotropha sp. (ex Lucina aurantia)]MBV2118896.1 hypothetical protein [Candidatus Thiodiazotropha sp. (ex Lucina aurantia)]